MSASHRCAQQAAEEYSQTRFLTVDFRVGDIGLSDEAAFKIFGVIREELIKAWLAGCAAGSDPKEAA